MGTLRGSLGCDFPHKSVSKVARFWGFPSSRVRGVLGRISSIPPFWTSFGGIKLGYGLLMRCSYYPLLTVNSCIKVRLDLQADKSPIVVKGPFFPRVVNPRYRIRGTNV
jgi:hypothetical protein